MMQSTAGRNTATEAIARESAESRKRLWAVELELVQNRERLELGKTKLAEAVSRLEGSQQTLARLTAAPMLDVLAQPVMPVTAQKQFLKDVSTPVGSKLPETPEQAERLIDRWLECCPDTIARLSVLYRDVKPEPPVVRVKWLRSFIQVCGFYALLISLLLCLIRLT